MQISRFFAVSAVGVLATSFLFAQDSPVTGESFTLNLCMAHDTDQIENETIVVKAGVKTDVPIRRTFNSEDGGSSTFIGVIRLIVPSPALMDDSEPGLNAETHAVGPKLSCLVRRGPDGQRLLDVELIDTLTEKHSPKEGILVLKTRQLRSVQPVRIGQEVTIAWPADEHGKVSRRITITVED